MFNGVVFGASGAVGFEFMKALSKSDKWNKIFVISRSMDPSFESYKHDPRIQFLIQPEILDLDPLKKELASQKLSINGVYNFLGSQVKHGEETFRKVDKEYVIQSC